jgi:hypothetical protein
MPIDVLRRLAATLAYRAAQVLRDVPPGTGGGSLDLRRLDGVGVLYACARHAQSIRTSSMQVFERD